MARQDEIDGVLAAWTLGQNAVAVMETLQAVGVPAGVVQRSSDLLLDRQYAHRGFYRYMEHAEMGHIPYAGHQFRMRGADHGPRSPAPLLGEHSLEVMRDLLGMSEEEIVAVYGAGAIA